MATSPGQELQLDLAVMAVTIRMDTWQACDPTVTTAGVTRGARVREFDVPPASREQSASIN